MNQIFFLGLCFLLCVLAWGRGYAQGRFDERQKHYTNFEVEDDEWQYTEEPVRGGLHIGPKEDRDD